MTEPSGVPSVEEAILAATPHLGYCRFPDDACLCRALEIRTRLAPALASVLAEARAEAVQEAAQALQHYADGFVGELHAAQWREAAAYIAVRASVGIPTGTARRSVPESEGR